MLARQDDSRPVDARVQPEIIGTYTDCALRQLGCCVPGSRNALQDSRLVAGRLYTRLLNCWRTPSVLMRSTVALLQCFCFVLFVDWQTQISLKFSVIRLFGLSRRSHNDLRRQSACHEFIGAMRSRKIASDRYRQGNRSRILRRRNNAIGAWQERCQVAWPSAVRPLPTLLNGIWIGSARKSGPPFASMTWWIAMPVSGNVGLQDLLWLTARFRS